ncbi:MAG TPA: hypothetical protein VF228_03670, partial [Iamia sp.]
RVVVEATGRGRAARPRRAELWLPGATGAPAPVVERRPTDAPTDAPVETPVDHPAEPVAWADAG